MEILGFRLRSGEDLIGQVLAKDDGFYVVKRPAVPMNVPQQDPNTGQAIQNQNGLTMLKWCPFADQEEFTFGPTDYVGMPYKIWDELEKFYLQSTSEIAIAGAGDVVQPING